MKKAENICHLCKATDLQEVIDLGMMPVSHNLRKKEETSEKTYPVKFHYCTNCGLLQICDAIASAILYDAKTYSTGFQKPKHIDDLLITALAHKAPGSIMDIGCNDGSLLHALKAHGFTELAGIEPNKYAASMAELHGYAIHHGFFTEDAAASLKKGKKGFDFLISRHVVEHVPDLHDFFAGINILLAEDGLLILEMPYVEAGFDANSPVILWEEHVSYFTEALAGSMLEKFGFEIVERRHYAFGGGSLAFVAKRSHEPPAELRKTPTPYNLEYFKNYNTQIARLKNQLSSLVMEAKATGHKIALYGAAPRSCTIINYAQLGCEMDYILDDRAEIQDLIMPGSDKVITGLVEAHLSGDPLLVLLGVGAENEHKVLAKLRGKLGYEPLSVSLFPPRDIWESLELAHCQVHKKAA